MSSLAALTLDLAGVSRLAGVQRPVVSVWRTRYAASAHPFPPPVDSSGGRVLFEAQAVAEWLQQTGRGNNPSAALDAAAHASPPGFDYAHPRHVAVVDALVTALALIDEEPSVSAIESLARRADADDRFMLAELRDVPDAWLDWARDLVDACFSPVEASRLLERRHAAAREGQASAGSLAPAATDFVTAAAAALSAQSRLVLEVSGLTPSVAFTVFDVGDWADLVVARSASSRAVRRRFVLEGLPAPEESTSDTRPRLVLARFPHVTGESAEHQLAAVNDLVLGLRPADRALVLAPASVLQSELSRAASSLRTDILRTGLVRAMAMLPAGGVPAAPRESLVAWVMSGDRPTEAIPDRVVAVADLSRAKWSASVTSDLVSDVAAVVAGAAAARRRSMRFVRLVRLSSLLASSGSLDLAGTPPARRERPRDIPALLDAARASLPSEVPSATPRAFPASSVGAASVSDLMADGHVRVLAGTRIAAHEFVDQGLEVIEADHLADGRPAATRFVDTLAFAAAHPSAPITQPGDVVFRTSPTARAWVDAEGARVVAYPARILRINESDPGGLSPYLVATDINAASAGPGVWRSWRLRRVPPAARERLDEALADLEARRLRLLADADALASYSALLASGVASGVVDLVSPAVSSAPNPK